MSLDERIAALRVYRWAEWHLPEPKWLRQIKARIYDDILREVYLQSITRELSDQTSLMRRLHQ